MTFMHTIKEKARTFKSGFLNILNDNFEIKSSKRSKITGIVIMAVTLLWVVLSVNTYISQEFAGKWWLLSFALFCPFILGLTAAFTVVIKKDILNKMKSVSGEELASLDKEFHDTLIESTDNMMFITIMEAVAGVYREWIDIVIKRADEDNIRKLLKYHEEIYTGITDRDKEKTIKAVENHYDLIEEML